MPDDRRFGIVWMTEEAAAAAFGLQGAFNDVALKLTRGASEAAVIAAVDTLLAPYGGTGAYGREDQVSHRFLDDELRQLRAMSWVMPPVFFLVAAFLVNLVLARLIALERSQIGLLKAIGYSDLAVAGHYLKLAAAIGVRRHRHRLGVRLVGWPGHDPALRGVLSLSLSRLRRKPRHVRGLGAGSTPRGAVRRTVRSAGGTAADAGGRDGAAAAGAFPSACDRWPRRRPRPAHHTPHDPAQPHPLAGSGRLHALRRRRLGRDPGRLALHFRRCGVPDRREPVPGQPPARDPNPHRGANRGGRERGGGDAGSDASRGRAGGPGHATQWPSRAPCHPRGADAGDRARPAARCRGPAGGDARARPADVRQARTSARRRPRRDPGGRVHERRPRDPPRAAGRHRAPPLRRGRLHGRRRPRGAAAHRA